MSKRLSSKTLLFAACMFALAILCCSLLNSSLSVTVDKPIEHWSPMPNRLYSIDRSFSVQTGDSIKTLQGKLRFSAENGRRWDIYISNGKYCRLEINGVTYIPKDNSDAILAPVRPDTDNTIIITYTEAGDPSFCNSTVYFASSEYAAKLQSISGYQRFFIIGMSAALCLYALSLYEIKRSEKYLLLLVFFTYSTSARTLGNALPFLNHNLLMNLLLLGELKLPWLDAAGNHNLLFMILKTLIAVLRLKLISEFITTKDHIKVCIRISLMTAAAVMLWCVIGDGYYPIQIWLIAEHLLELYLLTTGDIANSNDRYTLIIAWAFTIGLRLYETCCVSGIVAHGFIEAAIKPQGIIETFYILGFVVVINRKFASKFVEADRLSRSLEEINQNLEKIVDDRTAELEDTCRQLQLIQDQKSEFMANIVHNLKSPLFSLYGYTDMALDSLDEDKEHTRHCLQEINNNTEYVRQLIEKLSLCMRLESSSVRFNKVPLNIKTLLEQILSTSKPTAEAKEICINVNVPDEKLGIVGDALYLRQAIQNIVDNGIRHSHSNSEIDISAQQENGMVSILIRDEGEGMSEEQRKLIFGRYYSQNKSGATSSGLGLTIAMEIVSQHGGTITVESKPGEGSAFTVLLPAAAAEE